MGEIDVILNDDYAVLHVGDLRFYYGYEVTTAGERGFDLDDAEDAEWCFQVTRGKKVLMTIPCNELAAADETGEPAEMLLIGIGMWIVAQQKKEDAE
ncbi:MAG: hypothetical protein HQ559_01780 [Lentisphaerae bacterium]|nr:hypothetical protein [Lentisphaerota bacterium]